MTAGNFVVQVRDDKGNLLPQTFYDSLKARSSALRIPPWASINGQEDIDALMNTPDTWAAQKLSDFKVPETWLTQMSGRNIDFHSDKDSDGNPALTGQFEAPLLGLYYMTLEMTAGEGVNKIDYSKSFWVSYEGKTDYLVMGRVGKDTYLKPPYLPEIWGKTSNTADAEDLVWSIEQKIVKIIPSDPKISPSDFAEWRFDSKAPQSLIIHCKQKGDGKLTLNVTTEYGDNFPLEYDFSVT